MRRKARHKLEALLAPADVKVGGDRPWDIQVYNDEFCARVLSEGSMGLGESYMDGWWDCAKLDDFFYRILRAGLHDKIKPWIEVFRALKGRLANLQRPSRAYQIGQHHYDMGNTLFKCMLDRRLIYSCGYWENATSLDEAQETKLDLVCQKLRLQPGMRVLDIGCGWGGTAKFIAEKYQAEVVGITVSEEQTRFGKELCRGYAVDIRLQDYRSLRGKFDRVLSIGMFEHVGHKNYVSFMHKVKTCLKDDGLFLLHTIGGNRSVFHVDPWIQRYIFPNYMLPSSRQICSAIEGLFVFEDWHNFGADYDKTLMQWFRNFDTNWNILKNQYDDRFYRMWKYYLLSCAGASRARTHQLWQIVLSPGGVPGGYRAARVKGVY